METTKETLELIKAVASIEAGQTLYTSALDKRIHHLENLIEMKLGDGLTARMARVEEGIGGLRKTMEGWNSLYTRIVGGVIIAATVSLSSLSAVGYLMLRNR